jgi:large subunit ribosomal protein L24
MAAKIRKGDRVEVLTGRDKGKRGEVLRVIPDENRAVVQGIHMLTRHNKPRGMGAPGGSEKKEGTIDLSNLALIDPKTDKATRVGFTVLADGKKVRVAKPSGEVIDA